MARRALGGRGWGVTRTPVSVSELPEVLRASLPALERGVDVLPGLLWGPVVDVPEVGQGLLLVALDLARGRANDRDRRYRRVLAVITEATTTRRLASIAGLARAAGVHRSYLYRHPELLELIQRAQGLPLMPTGTVRRCPRRCCARSSPTLATVPPASRPPSDNCKPGSPAPWANRSGPAAGSDPPDPLAEAQSQLESIRQELLDTRSTLAERDEELEAARATNRQLMATLNASR